MGASGLAAACIMLIRALPRTACKLNAAAAGQSACCRLREAASAALGILLLLLERPVTPRLGEHATNAVARAGLQAVAGCTGLDT